MMHIFSAAQCLGYVAFVLGVAAFLQRDDRRLKALVAAECLAYTFHFSMLGNGTASMSAFISCGRSVLSLKTKSLWVAGAIVLLNLALGCVYAATPTAWLPIAASCLGTAAVFILSGLAMRMVLFVCTLLWLANNLISGSIGGTLLEAVIALANISTMLRMHKSGGEGSGAAGNSQPPATVPAA